MAPSVYFGDSGELISMIYTLGIPHPTGFPLYILLGRIFAFIPLANPAFRINLLSALFAACVPVLVFLCSLLFFKDEENKTLKTGISLAMGLLMTFSYTLWSQAVASRIYTLNAFFCGIALLCFLYFREKETDPRCIYFLAFISGLASGLHLSFIVFVLILWAYLFIFDFNRLKRKIPWILFFAAAGFSVYLYIILRGLGDTVLHWKPFSKASDFFNYFTQREYKGKMFSRDITGYLYFLGYLRDVLLREFSPVGLLLAAAGAVTAFVNKKRYSLILLLILVSNIILLALYGTFKDLQLAFRYFIPSYIAALLFAGYFLLSLKKYFKSSFIYGLVIAAALTPTFVLMLINNYFQNDRSRNFIAYNYPGEMTMGMPEKAYLFTSGDNQIYPLAYYKFVLGKLPKLTIFDATDTIFRDIDDLKAKSGSEKVLTHIITAFQQNYSPVFSATKLGIPLVAENLHGVVYLITPNKYFDNPLPWKQISYKNILYDGDIYHEFEEREVVGMYYYRLGENYLSTGRKDLFEYCMNKAVSVAFDSVPVLGNSAIVYSSTGNLQMAEALVLKALKIQPDNTELIFNLGSIYGQAGMFKEAAEMFERVTKLDPLNMNAVMYMGKAKQQMMQASMQNAMSEARDAGYKQGVTLFEAQKFDEALPYFKTDLEKNPQFARSNFYIGLYHSMKTEYDKAIPQFEEALKKEPDNTNTLNNLGLTYLNLSNNGKAKEYFKKSLTINPDQKKVQKILEKLH
jgi:tetratricopeptide (TPR) repeat protein